MVLELKIGGQKLVCPSFESTLQISIGWLSVISLVIPLALKVILPIRIIPIGKILMGNFIGNPLSA